MDHPKTVPCHAAPIFTEDLSPTLGSPGGTPFTDLARLAAVGTTEWPLRQIMALAGYDADVSRSQKSVGAYFYFITRPEILSVLEIWAEQDRHASSLLGLACRLGARPDLLHKVRPFAEDEQASKALRGSLADEPLTAMIATRRAILPSSTAEGEDFAQWSQKLRLFLLLRALQLLEAGATQDRFLGEACTAVRKACDRYRSDQADWLRPLASQTTDLSDFVADLEYRCTLTRADKDAKHSETAVSPSQTERHLLSTLKRIASGGPWWDPKSIRPAGTGPEHDVIGKRDPSLPSQTTPPAPPPLPPGFEGLVNDSPGDRKSGRYVTDEPPKGATPPQSRKHGKEILLGSVEEAMYLPSTWHHLSRNEEVAMSDRIRELLHGKDLRQRTGAALTLIAWIVARGMFDVETIACSAALTDDWSLDIEASVLRRRPPRFQRRVAAASMGASAETWLAPLADRIEVRLCSAAAQALQAATSQTQAPTDLGQLWKLVSPELPLDKWFNDTFTEVAALERLSSPMTAGALGAAVFAKSQDAVFARLIGSQTRTALPAACTYGSYQHTNLHDAWTSTSIQDLASLVFPPAKNTQPLNAAGSELDADLSRIAGALQELLAQYDAASTDKNRWVAAHNLLTSYVVIALLASTGARPVNSPFEDRNWLDLDRGLIYVEDKRSGPTTGARICVLSRAAVEVLESIYLPHLKALRELLRPTCPRMAAAIGQILQPTPDDEQALPFLFYLRAAPDFDWIEVSETQLSAHCGINWPLPWNIFRHLHATQLVRRKLHPEIVDALLSHGDRGAESHGDNSMRIPAEDIEAARPLIDALQVAFGLRVPQRAPELPARLGPGHADLSPNTQRKFGARARAVARERSQDAARRGARDEIAKAIGARPPTSLNAEEWQAIGRQMLFLDGSMPHPSASLRFDEFESYLEGAWKHERTLVQLRRKYRPVPEPTPMFTQDLLVAEGRVEEATRTFRAATAKFDIGGTAPGPLTAAVLGAFELVLSCRLAHPGMLLDVVHLRRNIRMVQFEGRYWLERANADQWQDGRPVLRLQLSHRAARWIGLALSSTRRDMKNVSMPDVLSGWMTGISGGKGGLEHGLRYLCHLREQTNAWNLSGALTAHLAGRQVMAALPHHDWYRLAQMHAPALPAAPIEADEFTDHEFSFAPPVGDPAKADKDATTATRCAALLDGITEALKPGGGDVPAIIAEIRRLTATSGFALGEAPQVLAHFACELLTRRRRTGKKVRLRVPTARRYWYSLVGPFIDIGHDRCLLDEDEESITEFYEDVIDWWRTHIDDVDGGTPQGCVTQRSDSAQANVSEEERIEMRVHDAARRTVAQLKDFQDFAARAYGTEEVDWSGIDLGARLAVGRPALILEAEFESALSFLVGDGDITHLPDETLSAAFVLLACSRFGLRVGEAVGMYRSDWVDCNGALVVLVRSNSVRGLKTRHSRRQVPLVETLSTTATQVVTEVIRRWELGHRADADAPLLPGIDAVNLHLIKGSISSQLLDLLKQVTRSDAARIHGLRHSFACRLLALVTGVSPGPGLPVSDPASLHARRLLLGATKLDRRTLWAIARALGHASPITTVRCYLHALELITAAEMEGPIWNGTGISLGAVLNMDALTRDSLYGAPQITLKKDSIPDESLPLRRINFLMLLASGYRPERAIQSARLDKTQLNDLVVRLGQLPGRGASGLEIPTKSEILSSIPVPRWHELTKLLKQAEPIQLDRDASKVHNEIHIGSRRQLVLFQRAHFEHAKAFLDALDLSPKDFRIVMVRDLHTKKKQWISELGLDAFAISMVDCGKDFRVDTAEAGDPPEPVTHRAALLPSLDPARRVQTSQEMLVLWALIHVAQPSSDVSSGTSASSKSGV